MRIKHAFWMVDLTFWLSLKQRSIQPSLTPNFTSLGLECVERTGPKAAGFKAIPLFYNGHPLLRITLRHPRWQWSGRFFLVARKD